MKIVKKSYDQLLAKENLTAS